MATERNPAELAAFLAAPEWSSRGAILANVAAHVVAAGPAAIYRLIVPAIMARYGVSAVEVGYMFSLSAICTGVCAILVGINARRMNFRQVCTAATAIHVLGALVSLFAPTFTVLLVGRALSACSDGVLICAANAALARSSKPTRNWTWCAVAVGLTGAIGNAVVGRLIPLHGLEAAFLIVAVLGLVVLPTQLLIPGLRPPPGVAMPVTVREAPFRAIAHALSGRTGLLLMAMIVLFTTGSGMLNPFDAVIGTSVGLTIPQIGDIRGTAFAVATAALFFGLWLGDRVGRAWPFLLTGMLVALSDGAVGTAISATVFAVAIIAGDAAHRLNGPYYASVVARHDPSGSLNGAAIAFINVGLAIGPVIGGHLRDATGSYAVVGICAMTLGLAGFGMMALMAFRQERAGK